MNMKRNFFKVILLSTVLVSNSDALTTGARKLVRYETKSNAVTQRDSSPVPMPHFEIPLDMLETDIAERFLPIVDNHLLFTKDGKKYVRWILNPEDTKWFDEVQRHFEAKGLKLEKKYYFTGYQTASRSYIVEDPKKKIQFSVKSSTDKTGGWWADKKQPVGEAVDSRLNAEFLKDMASRVPFQNFIFLDEPAILKIPAINQAVVIRDLGGLTTRDGRTYVPGFSVLHEKTGRIIAEKNGSKDPYAFWTEHYVKAAGRALGELAGRTGMQFDSPHSQNFLVELDKNMKPTGRIVLRDLADLYIDKSFMRALHKNPDQYFNEFSQKENLVDEIKAGFGPLHGNTYPSWVDRKAYIKWKYVFLKEFEKTFISQTGLRPTAFKQQNGYLDEDYILNRYVVSETNPEAADFWKNMKKYKHPKGLVSCSKALEL